MTTVLIDNFDSFTHNLAHLIHRLGEKLIVVPNTVRIDELPPDLSRAIISAGPGSPHLAKDVGSCPAILERFVGVVPVLGVCLGHQLLGLTLGATVSRLPQVRHGSVSRLTVAQGGAMVDSSDNFARVMRYHSLQVDADSLPPAVSVTSNADDDNAVMSMEVPELMAFGVQFHPESIATPTGTSMVQRFFEIQPRS